MEKRQSKKTILNNNKPLKSFEEQFIISCENGDLELAKSLYLTIKNKKCYTYNYIFENTCFNNHLEVAKWLYTLKDHLIIDFNFNYIFKSSLVDEDLHELSKWIYSIKDEFIDPTDKIIIDNEIFKNVLLYGDNLKNVKWIYSLRNDINNDIDIYKFDRNDYNEIINKFCELDKLDFLEWFLSLNNDIIYDVNEAFINSCYFGNINIAKYLYSKENVDIHYKSEKVFLLSCASNKFEIAKWIYSLGKPLYIYDNYNYIISLCIHEKVDKKIINWLYSIQNKNYCLSNSIL